VICCNSDLLQQ